ncbi:6,7-dimethyl-8-ribityllumazine synthase [Proteobacteria bacterium 005FR1]|nr:6,7-dimethyl-8-ribityllumazine synthase [Proteobacteria bacterium 005FR1]
MNQFSDQKANLLQADTLPSPVRIAFIQSCWSKDIVDQARDAFIEEIAQHGIDPQDIDCFEVPGGLEIPLQAKLLASSGRYQIIVAAGMIVDGGIYRHEFVADAIIKSFMDVQLETEVPIISAVLTPHHYHEHEAHHAFFFSHFRIKGKEAALACVKTLKNVQLARDLSLK